MVVHGWTTIPSLIPKQKVNSMSKLDNEPFLGFLAETEAQMPRPLPESVMNGVRAELLSDWRSLPSNHPFYIEGAATESLYAGWANDIAEALNIETGFAPETSDAPTGQAIK